jgi:hypothetical protein
LNSQDKQVTFNHLVEILKQCALEEAEKPQAHPETKPKKRTRTVSKRLELSEAGIREFKDTDSNELRAATSGQ